MRALTQWSRFLLMSFQHRNNEALAREGIDTFSGHKEYVSLRLPSNNEALAREGIDTNPQYRRYHLSSVRNNEALAREGIDTRICRLALCIIKMRNNEALAREGIDTEHILSIFYKFVRR